MVRPKYEHNNDISNRRLRLALYKAWGEVCYFDTGGTAISHVQIDHIIPREKFNEGIQTYYGEKAPGFGVDDLENLAPICDVCNTKKKRDTIYCDVGTGTITDALHRAALRADAVEKKYNGYASLKSLEDAVFSIVDLPDASVLKDHYNDLIRLVTQRIADAGLDPADHYIDHLKIETEDTTEADWPAFSPGPDQRLALITTKLDSTGRFARRAVEQLFNLDFDLLIVSVVDEVKDVLRSRAADETGVTIDFCGTPDRFVPQVSTVRIEGIADESILHVHGSVNEIESAIGFRDNGDGEELSEDQFGAQYVGKYCASLYLNNPDEITLNLADVDIEVYPD